MVAPVPASAPRYRSRVDLQVSVTPELERELVRLEPWMHPFRLGDSAIVGRFKSRLDTTVAVSTSPPDVRREMEAAYGDYIAGDPYWNVRTLVERLGGAGDKTFLDIAAATGR